MLRFFAKELFVNYGFEDGGGNSFFRGKTAKIKMNSANIKILQNTIEKETNVKDVCIKNWKRIY